MSLDLLKSSWIDIEFRGMSFREIADAEIDILAGVGGKTAQALRTIGVSTVRDLATLPAYLNAIKADPSDAAAMEQPVESVVDPSLAPELRKVHLSRSLLSSLSLSLFLSLSLCFSLFQTRLNKSCHVK